jgi:MoaA/NifB/PqqE/SkfB family radical SAM enzyme
MSSTHVFDFIIQWHLTERCNLRCSHCYQGDAGSRELSLQDVQTGLSEIADLFASWASLYDLSFSPSFNVTGGEPLLRPDLFDVLRGITSRGYEAFLLTNGTLIDAEQALMLSDVGVTGVQVSIEGPEDVHDRVRGAGSYAASLQGIEHLVRAGMPVTMNATLSAMNVQQFKALIPIASSLGVQRLGFSRLVPSGRGAGLVDAMLSREQVREAYDSVRSMRTGGVELVSGDPLFGQMGTGASPEEAGSAPRGGCAAGVSGLTVLADGTLVPCRRLPVPIGNITSDSVREVWASSPVLEALRDRSRYHGACGACSRWSDCRGCRAIAYAHARSRGVDDLLAEDPQCFINAVS